MKIAQARRNSLEHFSYLWNISDNFIIHCCILYVIRQYYLKFKYCKFKRRFADSF
jgi:hypothetical protein